MRTSVLCFVFLLFLLSSNIALVKSTSWSQVAQFSDLGDYQSDYFNCSHVLWRINWDYTPDPLNPTAAALLVTVFRQNVTMSITSAGNYGNVTTNGTSDVLEQGTFYLTIHIANLDHYTVVVEQDLDSPVSEFSSIFLLPFFTIAIVIAVMLARRQGHIHSRSQP
jgi:hypothetical protein